MRRLKLFIFQSFLCIISINAQNLITIKGKVIGYESKTPLPYCAIQIEGSTISVITNDDGLFELHIPESLKNDTLLISYIGYEQYKQGINKILLDNTALFKLQEKPYLLGEVVVRLPLTVETIIKNINASFKNNYNTNPFYTEGFFREYLRVNGGYDKLMEGAITSRSDGFNVKKSRWEEGTIYLTEVRASLNASLVKDQNNANNIAFIIGFPEKDIFSTLNNKKNHFLIAQSEYRNDDIIITLKCDYTDQKYAKETELIYKINSTNWAIEEYNYNTKITKEQDNQIVQSVVDSTKMRYVTSNFIFKFTPVDDKYYFTYAKATSKRLLYNPNSKVELYLNTEYITNNIKTGNCEIDIQKKMDKKESMYKQICMRTYHPDFWKSYNLIVANPELEQIRNDLNEKGNINDQFNNSGKYPTDKKKRKKKRS